MPLPNRNAFFVEGASYPLQELQRLRGVGKPVEVERQELQDAVAGRVGMKAAGGQLQELQDAEVVRVGKKAAGGGIPELQMKR